MSKEFKVIETQEQFDEAISKRIGELQAKHSEATAELQKKVEALNAENASLNKAIEDSKSKYAEYDSTLESLQGRVKEYEVNALKNRIAHEVGLDFKAVSYLQGTSEEEIKASAEGLKSLIPSKKIAPPASSEPVKSTEDESKQGLREMLKNL